MPASELPPWVVCWHPLLFKLLGFVTVLTTDAQILLTLLLGLFLHARPPLGPV